MRGKGSSQFPCVFAFLQEEMTLLGCRPAGPWLWEGSFCFSSFWLGSWGGPIGLASSTPGLHFLRGLGRCGHGCCSAGWWSRMEGVLAAASGTSTTSCPGDVAGGLPSPGMGRPPGDPGRYHPR